LRGIIEEGIASYGRIRIMRCSWRRLLLEAGGGGRGDGGGSCGGGEGRGERERGCGIGRGGVGYEEEGVDEEEE
jgi:hypothetical protein